MIGFALEQNGNIGIALVFLFAGVLYWFTGFQREEIYSYAAHCVNDAVVAPLVYDEDIGMTLEELRKSIQSCQISSLGKTRFSINLTMDEVTYRSGDFPMLEKQQNCIILDKENWHCSYSNGSGGIGFVDGLRSMGKDQVKWGVFYQRRWQYHVTSVLNIFGPVRSSWLIPYQQIPY